MREILNNNNMNNTFSNSHNNNNNTTLDLKKSDQIYTPNDGRGN